MPNALVPWFAEPDAHRATQPRVHLPGRDSRPTGRMAVLRMSAKVLSGLADGLGIGVVEDIGGAQLGRQDHP